MNNRSLNILNAKHKFAILGALILVVSSLVTAQNNSTETLTVGFIGNGSDTDQQLYQAAVLAAEQLNSEDDDDEVGILSSDDTRYELDVVYYEANTSSETLDALDNAVEDDAIAILGPHDETLAAPIRDAGTPAVPVLLGIPDAPTGSNMYRLASSYDVWAQSAADYLVNERKFEQVGLIVADTSEGLDAADTFRETVGEDVIVVDLTHAADKEDFSSDAQTIRDSEAEALFVWTLDAQMVSLLEALNAEGWNGQIVYAGLDDGFLSRIDAELTAGLYGLANWSPSAYDAQSQTFVSEYTARWEQSPIDAAAAYYDAVMLIGRAVENAGDDIGSELASVTDYDGVQGKYNNLQTDGVLILQSVEGSLVEAARYEATVCSTCPDTWLADISDQDVDESSAFTLGLIVSDDARGENIEQATRLAVRNINDKGGVIGSDGVRYTLDLRVYEAATAEEAAARIEQAQNDGVQILLGPDYNAQILPNLFAAEGAGVAQLTSATNPQVTDTEPANYVFALRANDSALAEAAANYLVNERELEMFATVAVRTDYGLDTADSFADGVNEDDDARVTLLLEHEVDETDFSVLAQQIVDANVQAVFVSSTQPAATALLEALNGMNWEGTFVYPYLTPDFVQTSAIGSSIEVIGAVNWWETAQDWLGEEFTTRYTARYGEAPLPQSAAYYDSIYLIAQALQEAGAEVESIQSWIVDLESFRGVQGSYQPGDYANGELTRMAYLLGVQGDTLSELARYNGETCVVGCGS
jgi:branched-chain amino acid transport system substrate-binding protein